MLDPREHNRINQANAERGHARGFWTQERFENLKMLAADGFSLSEIADQLGDGCTRGMVAGKARDNEIRVDGREKFKKKNRAKWLRWRIGKLQQELAELEQSETHPSPSVCGVSRETELAEADA